MFFFWNVNTEHGETRGCKQKHGNAGKWRTQRARYLTMNFGWVILECFCRWRCTPMLWEWFIQRMSKTYGGICSLHCRNYFSIVLKRVVFIVYQPSCMKQMVSHNHRLKVVEVASKVDNWIHQNERQMRDSSKPSSKPCQLGQLYPQCHDYSQANTLW